MSSLLLIAVFLPTLAAVLLHGDRDRARGIALATTLAVLMVSIALAAGFPQKPAPGEVFAETNVAWLGGAGVDVRFSLALDGLSLWLFMLTSLLMVAAVLVGWKSIGERATLYYRLLLLLETGMLGVFVARDVVLFYVFFESTLIPLFFLIGLWGGSERRDAAMKFFLYTLAGSVLTLLGLLAIVLWNYQNPGVDPASRVLTFSIPRLTESLQSRAMPLAVQIAVFAALFAGFAVKTPLWPLHTWLPLAHVEAPTAGSVLLAGVLLKVGVYGFLRFSVPMLPQATAALLPWLLWLALAGVLYGALVALAQNDLKRMVAYSSVSHMGFCMLGVFAVNRLSVSGAALQMIAHGLATGGLFAVVGMLYERFHTRRIDDFGGLARRMPRLASLAMVFTLSSIALPGTAGFAGEFPLLLGVFQRGWAGPIAPDTVGLRAIAVLSLGGVVLGAWYMLWMFQRVFFGPLTLGEGQGEGGMDDLSLREVLCLAPLAAAILWIGLQPSFFLDRMSPTLDELIGPAMQAADQWPSPPQQL